MDYAFIKFIEILPILSPEGLQTQIDVNNS